MSTLYLKRENAIKKLTELAQQMVELQQKQQSLLKSYNELLQQHFGLVEDGKPMTKLDTIKLIQAVVKKDLEL